MWRKFILDLIIVAVLVVAAFFLYPIFQKRMGAAFWEGEEEANNRRLFGDAWKDV
jgi:hypothetical protein